MRKLLFTWLLLTAWMNAGAQSTQTFKQTMRSASPEYFNSAEARRIGDQLLLYQRVTGGWPKNIDMARQLSAEERSQVEADKQKRNDSTTDNDATTLQMTFLARLYQQTGDTRYRDAFRRAVDYLLSGQYDSGGWPQFWPEMHGYQVHITYNDHAMLHTLMLLRDIAQQREPYQGGLTDRQQRRRLTAAFDRGIECILNTQITTADGELTVWCQQHDRETLKPAAARAFELPSYCSMESAGLVGLLMELPKPSERVKRAVHAAMRWFDKYKLTGYRLERTGQPGAADRDTRLVADAKAPALWARFYDLERCEPYVCDRDGVPRRRLEQIGSERRNGYAWYSTSPSDLFPLYEQWAARHDPEHRVTTDLHGRGANERGIIQWFRRPVVNVADFDAVVSPGDSIQLAIEQAPAEPQQPYKILIRKGVYRQKVIIDRPNIVLVGEDRDSTLIVIAETAKTQQVKEYPGNTTHQMAIFGRATRTIIINCTVKADGNDALSLWAPGGNGMYYHADLTLECPGVDFLCPRGWCYATRCRFMGDGRAIIWHDGRGDRSKKLVVKDSYFDARRPTILGRYHHDAQFLLLNCKLSKQILDTNISYAYTDKVLDPCPWGLRTYYYNCLREGGHSGWLNNNLQQADGAPAYHTVTAQWTFAGQWNPERRVRDLWAVLAY